MPASNPFNLFLKHFLMLSRTSEIFQVTQLNGTPCIGWYGKLNYISKFSILCYVVSYHTTVYMYIIFIHCPYYIKFIHHIIFTTRKFILQNCDGSLIFPTL